MTPASPTVPGAKLRLIQPDISQGASFAPENKDAILSRYFALSDRATASEPTAADGTSRISSGRNRRSPSSSRETPQALGDIADFLRDGATLVTGAARVETNGSREPAYFNSIEVLDRRGLSRERYDKQHLVPFGEYVPFESWLEQAGVTQFVQVPGGFTPGTGRRLLTVPGLPDAMPLICYEAIFPIEVGDALYRRAADGMDAEPHR